VELRDRILAGIAVLEATDDTVNVDVTALLHRLLLFEQVVIKSIRLKELPTLLHAFGYAGLRLLLDAGAMRIICEAATVGQTGQLAVLDSRMAKGLLPLGSYSFAVVREHDRREYIHDCLQEILRVGGLSDREAITLKGDVAARILPHTDVRDVGEALITDAVGNRDLVRRAIVAAVARELGIALPLRDLRVQVNQLDAEDIQVETNLQRLLSIDMAQEHKLVERGLLGIGGLNLRVATMKTHRGVDAFEDSDLPLLEDKLTFLLVDVLPAAQESRFHRILHVTDLPEADLSEPRSIDVDRLLELRSSADCREFRAWLRESDGLSNDAVRDLLPGLRDRLARAVRGRGGRAARFVVSTGVGLSTGDVTGTGASILDSFVLERLLPRPGPLAWLALTYPSVFTAQ
jgi:hypothetical protein